MMTYFNLNKCLLKKTISSPRYLFNEWLVVVNREWHERWKDNGRGHGDDQTMT